ncbi:flagellar brake protein [Paenibacillus protaetiae]|uniref:Glycosyl transferase n=1 Tax=Paenibacillus protaetiae TaxID=2509456 RepID=A0A4P6ETF9_9BACL|nr:flagellar brake domain-containing protein [Paenibacillus protaetiae]QAY66184.1 glycosyl transferase [Paenibacillus protaetiae]
MLPKINQMLFLHVATPDEEEAGKEYKARIADWNDEFILMETPIHEQSGRMKKLFLGDELSFYYITETGVKHYFGSHVLGFQQDAIPLVKIRTPDTDRITKVQRRNFLRVPAELEIAVKLPDHEQFVAVTDDVGGGGISFLCESKWQLHPGQLLVCWLLLNYKNGTIEHAPFAAEIVRIVEVAAARKQVMIKFVSINDYERQKIIRYCFERQFDFRNR